MNILFVTMVDPSGKSGQNIYSKEVAAALGRNRAVNLSMICPKPIYGMPSELSVNLKKVRFLPEKRTPRLRWHITAQVHMFRALKALIAEEEPVAVVAPLKPSLLVAPLLAKQYDICYILLVEGMGMRNVRKGGFFPGAHHLARIVFWLNARTARQIYAPFEEAAKWIEKLLGSSREKPRIFSNAVDPELLSPTPIPEARGIVDLSLSDSDFVVGFVGSLRKRHGLNILVKAIDELRHNEGDIKLLIVGEGPEYGELKTLVHEKNLEGIVIFAGFVPHNQVAVYISACDVLYGTVDPREVSNPMKCYEYLACARPIITSRRDDFSFVEEQNVGITIEAIKVETIAAAIRRLYLIGPEDRSAMGSAGRAYIMEHHTWDQLAELILEDIKL